ncbi:MAG: hypothetical protein E7454_04525 [Ruminococcaceae bacterium]|nr:hypothetical protein [Oscillospiraceae bacterium]
MSVIIYFDNENQTKDRCAGQAYYNFLDYAFSKTDYFMLVYVNYYGKGYSKETKRIMNDLSTFKVKSRTNPSWPGTLNTYTKNTTYKIVFYRNTNEGKEILKQVKCLSDWTCPAYPQDLAFFKGGECWFYSVGHEKIGAIIGATEEDFIFLELNNLAKRSDARPTNNYYRAFNEKL